MRMVSSLIILSRSWLIPIILFDFVNENFVLVHGGSDNEVLSFLFDCHVSERNDFSPAI